MNTIQLSLYIISNTLGYFIFLIPPTLFKSTSNIYCLLIYPVCALLILFVSFCYDMLHRIYPNGHGDSTYITDGYNLIGQNEKNENRDFEEDKENIENGVTAKIQEQKLNKKLRLGDILGSTYSIVSAALLIPCFTSISVNLIFQSVQNHLFMHKIIFLFSFIFLNAFLPNYAIKLQNVLVIVRMFVLGIFILLGFLNVNQVIEKNNFEVSTNEFDVKWFFRSILWVCGSFDGFNSANFISYKIKNKKLKNAMIIAIVVECAIYMFICFNFYKVLGINQIKNTNDVVQLYLQTILKRRYNNNLQMNKFLGEIVPCLLIILPLTGIFNGCLIVLKSIISFYFLKSQNYLLMLMGIVISILTLFDTGKIVDRVGFLINLFYFMGISTLLIRYLKGYNRKIQYQSNKLSEINKETRKIEFLITKKRLITILIGMTISLFIAIIGFYFSVLSY